MSALLCIALSIAAAVPVQAQPYGSGGDFVEEFTKQLTQFTDLGPSYRAVVSIPYPDRPSSGFPRIPQPREARVGPAENIEGVAQNLIVAGAEQNVPPLHGEPGPFAGTVNLNEFLGATRFYDAGVFGMNAVAASIEGGRAWNQHETLLHAVDIPQNLQPNQIDRHATWTSMLLAGRPDAGGGDQHQIGIAPLAELHTGGFATAWAGNRYSFAYSFFGNVLFDQYYQPMVTGLAGPEGGRTADVVNSSYVIVGEPAAGVVELMLDAMATTNPNAVMVMGTGNSGEGVNTIGSPATGYNNIAVSSLTSTTGYETASAFTSGGDIDYMDPVNGVFAAGRRGVDIAAPGEDIGSAYYGGETGGNASNLQGDASGPLGGPNYYTRDLDGTSYAAPLVSGGVALLQDAAQIYLPDVPAARDARVIKAALLNSAHKTTGWDNGQVPHENGNGGVSTDVALDPLVGTGRMDLDAAFDQFLSGTTDVANTNPGSQGQVAEIGWDFGLVAEGTPTDYFIEQPLIGGSTLTTTLSWFRDRRIVDSGQGFTFVDDNFSDLDLEVWSVVDGAPEALISESTSPFNSTEHLSFSLPQSGQYMIRVKWFQEWFDVGEEQDPNQTLFGVAWAGAAIPEFLRNGGFDEGLVHYEDNSTGDGSVQIVNPTGDDPVLEMSVEDGLAEVSQVVGLGNGRQPLIFGLDFRFLTEDGTLEALLDENMVVTLNADGIQETADFYTAEPLTELENGFSRLRGVLDPTALADPGDVLLLAELALRLHPGSLAQVQIDNVILTPVPEPASATLVACSLLGLGWQWRRRRSRLSSHQRCE